MKISLTLDSELLEATMIAIDTALGDFDFSGDEFMFKAEKGLKSLSSQIGKELRKKYNGIQMA